MTAIDFVMHAWGLGDEAERKEYVHAHVHSLPRAEVEAAVIQTLEERGWQVGLIMVALRILQAEPSEAILHHLMAMVSEGATYVPGGTRLRKQLDGHLKGLIAKQPALADAARRYRRPDWAKHPGERAAAKKTAAKKAAKKAAPKKAPAKKASPAKKAKPASSPKRKATR